MVRGCSILNKDESYKLSELVKQLENEFSFLPRIYFPNIIERSKLANFNLANHELFSLNEEIVLAPEYSSMFVQDATSKFNSGYYIQACFRKEKPQLNRKRQFYQFGIEMKTYRDAEFFILDKLINFLSLKFEFTFNFNNQGTLQERTEFLNNLPNLIKEYNLCLNCVNRLSKGAKLNLFKILECTCNNLITNLESYLKPTEKDELITKWISKNQKCSINKNLFRGIEYYNNWTFDIISKGITIGGGGYYSNGYFGFALGLDRIINLLPNEEVYNVYWLDKLPNLTNFLSLKPKNIKIYLQFNKPPKFIQEPAIVVTSDNIYLFKYNKKQKIVNLTEIWN